jgi:hypothetical protein
MKAIISILVGKFLLKIVLGTHLLKINLINLIICVISFQISQIFSLFCGIECQRTVASVCTADRSKPSYCNTENNCEATGVVVRN